MKNLDIASPEQTVKLRFENKFFGKTPAQIEKLVNDGEQANSLPQEFTTLQEPAFIELHVRKGFQANRALIKAGLKLGDIKDPAEKAREDARLVYRHGIKEWNSNITAGGEVIEHDEERFVQVLGNDKSPTALKLLAAISVVGGLDFFEKSNTGATSAK